MRKNLCFIALTLLTLNSCKYTEAPSAGLAKEMCSCLFISGQTEEYCRFVTKESRILAKWEADYNRKEVTAKGANFTSKAVLDENPRYGCSLVSIDQDPQDYDDRHNDR